MSKSNENLANNSALNVQEDPTSKVRESPRRDCPLLVVVKHYCP